MDLFFALNIGVIGGADGPTAIFVSGGPSVWFWVGVGITVVAAVGLFVYWFQKRKYNWDYCYGCYKKKQNAPFLSIRAFICIKLHAFETYHGGK